MTEGSASVVSGATMGPAGFRPASSDGRSASGPDATNFLLADVCGELGSYLDVCLVTQQHWSQTEVGWVATLSGLFGLAAHTPISVALARERQAARSFRNSFQCLNICARRCGPCVSSKVQRSEPGLRVKCRVSGKLQCSSA